MREGVWQGARGGRGRSGAWRWEGPGEGGAPRTLAPAPTAPHLIPHPVPGPQLLASLPLSRLPPLGVSASLLCVCVCVVCQGGVGSTLECLQLLPTQAWGFLGLQQEGLGWLER